MSNSKIKNLLLRMGSVQIGVHDPFSQDGIV